MTKTLKRKTSNISKNNKIVDGRRLPSLKSKIQGILYYIIISSIISLSTFLYLSGLDFESVPPTQWLDIAEVQRSHPKDLQVRLVRAIGYQWKRTQKTRGGPVWKDWSGAKKMKHVNFYTPRKINMEPKNGGLEYDVPFQLGDFQVPY